MTTEAPTKLYTALLAAMRQMGPVLKNANNPAFRTKYADLGAVIDAIEGPLWENGLLIVQRFTPHEGVPMLLTELIHAESGQTLSSVVPVVAKDPNDPQKMGGAITYYRRYSLLALLGLAPEDDDGNSAAKPAPRPAERPQAQRHTPTPTIDPDDDLPEYPTAGSGGHAEKHGGVTAWDDGRRQTAPQAPPAALPIDMVLAELDRRDKAGEAYAAIVQYAREQGGRFDEATKERINERVRGIQARRKASAPAPASIAV